MSDFTEKEIDERIAVHRAEIEKLQEKLKNYKKLTCQQQIAIMLHKHNCHWNHTDGCSWEYEGDDWTQVAHAGWLRRANKLYDFMKNIWLDDATIVKNAEELILILKD